MGYFHFIKINKPRLAIWIEKILKLTARRKKQHLLKNLQHKKEKSVIHINDISNDQVIRVVTYKILRSLP